MSKREQLLLRVASLSYWENDAYISNSRVAGPCIHAVSGDNWIHNLGFPCDVRGVSYGGDQSLVGTSNPPLSSDREIGDTWR